MKIYVNEMEPFRAYGSNMAIAATSNDYVLEYSVDGVNWTPHQNPIPAGETLLVANLVQGMYLRLTGNAEAGVVVLF